MHRTVLAVAIALFVTGFAIGSVTSRRTAEAFTPKGFVVEHEVVVAVDPAEAWDAFTGDILPWWDHHFSESPKVLEIQPRPGGHFLELFDEEGNGAIHATVTQANAPKELHFTGPLGFGSQNVNLSMSHRLRFDAVDGQTFRGF